MDDFQCPHCHKFFARKKTIETHKCIPRERKQELKTIIGQSAFSLYCKWLTAYNRRTPDMETFITSRYYNAFIRFAKYAKSIRLANIDVFISIMKERDLDPVLWTRHDVYSFYLEYLDREASPLTNAEITIKTCYKIAEILECNVSDIFNHLEINQIIKLIQERRISPWILLYSKRFKQSLNSKASPEQRQIINDLIRPMYWKLKFSNHPKEVKLMQTFVAEMGI